MPKKTHNFVYFRWYDFVQISLSYGPNSVAEATVEYWAVNLKTTVFQRSKYYVITTLLTRLKIASNMADPISIIRSDSTLKASQLDLKNLKLFLIRVKELFEPIVLWRNCDGCLFVLKAFSWEIDLWVTLGEFELKRQVEKESL